MLLDQFESLKDMTEKRLVGIKEGICQALDVLDKKFGGRAEEVLMQGSSGQPAELQQIGETPNPDDEETHRKSNRQSIIPF